MRKGLSFSHVGIYVRDLPAMTRFYTELLDFTITDAGKLEGPAGPVELVFLSRDPAEHHQIVLATGRPEQLPFNVINQISLRADSLATLRGLYERMAAAGATDIHPITHGNAVSVYARDPEGNRLELFVDTPWYVSQPMRVPVDFSESDASLMQKIEAHARSLPGFEPRGAWQARMAEKMGLV
ncbi:VOC family protein [Cupriavidus sp. WKF15]|uniref:VOC family protein n=1 Tax=Cupriavidus sp. WKF15 TaxID=3032282 RepID=UPI0023E2ACA3|nr:VOC family protein [Cupriavidus sp. WKF15]WER50350.1 VOC family protein [Cupriavidus sp. WKF15]